jgi:proteasome lid subunit RPN8/RPN11
MSDAPADAPIIALPRPFLDEMIAHALEDAPVECCGIVAARDGAVVGIYRARNAEASPFRFTIDPMEYAKLERRIEAEGGEVIGFYHSHTGSEARPSQTDIRRMGPLFGPPFVHFVIGVSDPKQPHARVFTIEDTVAREHTYDLRDG